ncbi:amino acid adenylation domain-containing protein [Streptomyces californicus]|uniref:amino acid adenylation domain-containing protein n=1 Tax=Streptomyces californicus TaxID=67351 RepID=UPI0036D0BFB0
MKIPQQVLDQARRSPDAVAIEDDQGALTYRVLARRSLRTAAALRHRFPGPGIIALRLPPGRHHVVAALAAMLNGRPYLSMDPSEPPGRVRRFLEASRIRAVVGTAAQDHSHQAVSLSDLLRHCAPDDPREPNPRDPAGAGEGAYVARTSGSTGIQKGVLLGHAGLANLVSWNNRTYGLGPGCRQLQTAGIGFDAAVWETWPVLCAGATLVVAPAEIRLSPAALVDYARSKSIGLLFAPTPIAEMIVDLDDDKAVPWHTLLTGGDLLRLRRIPRGWRIVNHYGPAEATVVTTWHPVTDLPHDGLPPIGRPIDGLRVALWGVDGAHRPVPGVRGEIVISGAGVALEYVNRQAETAAAFGPVPGLPGRWYRTGDRAVVDSCGSLLFEGRTSTEQVNVRGVRIEVAEVEVALMRLPQIRQAAVGAIGQAGAHRVLGAVVVTDDEGLTPSFLRAALLNELPTAALPVRVIRVPDLPLTAHGKIDRRAVGRLLNNER